MHFVSWSVAKCGTCECSGVVVCEVIGKGNGRGAILMVVMLLWSFTQPNETVVLDHFVVRANICTCVLSFLRMLCMPLNTIITIAPDHVLAPALRTLNHTNTSVRCEQSTNLINNDTSKHDC
jgi:hypothetical protein